MKKKKVCYYDFKEFSQAYDLEYTEESLYLFIVDLSKKAFNIKRLLNYIFYVDNLFCKEDVINDAFIFAVEYFKENNSYSSKVFGYYLLNLLKYVNRKKRKHMDNVPFSEVTENTYEETESEISSEQSMFIQDVLHKLKKEERELVENYFFKSKTYQDIADELNQNKSSVKRRMDKILLKLKDELEINNITSTIEFFDK